MLIRKEKIFSILYLLFGLILFIPAVSYAQCTSPASPVGGIAYDSAGDYLAVMACDGSDWVPWAGWTVTGYPAPQYSSGGSGANAIDDLTDAATNYTSGNMYVGQGVAQSANGADSENSFFGYNAGRDLTSGNRNTFFGHESGLNNENGNTNTAVGKSALEDNIGGDSNAAFGYAALNNSTGNANTSVGYSAMSHNTSGTGNVAIGYKAGGNSLNPQGAISSNVFVGYLAGADISTGGGSNTIVGYQGGQNITTGDDNTLLGKGVGQTLQNGNANILVGFDVDVTNAADSNKLNIGNIIFGSGMHTAIGHIGINDTTPDVALDVVGDINYTGQIVDVSDIRLKENIRPLDSPLKKLTALNGIAFEMKGDPEHVTEYGVSAQDVEKVFPELVHQVDEDGTLGVNYNGLIAPLIEAMKEQQAQIEALQAEIEYLKTERNDNKPGEL